MAVVKETQAKDERERRGTDDVRAHIESARARLELAREYARQAQVHFARARAIREGRPLPPLPEELPR